MTSLGHVLLAGITARYYPQFRGNFQTNLLVYLPSSFVMHLACNGLQGIFFLFKGRKKKNHICSVPYFNTPTLCLNSWAYLENTEHY